ncbi:MAG: phosphotransferase [Ornithinibacter sp.]
MTSPPPSPNVLSAFGVVGPAVPLPGGRGASWRVGEVVLKPDVDAGFQQWLGTVVAGIDQQGFRLPVVRRADGGDWVVQGWGAQSMLPGATVDEGPADWGAIITASRALHAATADLSRPAFLDLRSDPWAAADRAAWGETPRRVSPGVGDLVRRLDAVPAPPGRPQLVHGDLAGNVLVVPAGPPSVIDFSPYWRPSSYAEGIVLADALCWHGAPPEILRELAVPIGAVARGLFFRLLTSSGVSPTHGGEVAELARYQSVMRALDL